MRQYEARFVPVLYLSLLQRFIFSENISRRHLRHLRHGKALSGRQQWRAGVRWQGPTTTDLGPQLDLLKRPEEQTNTAMENG